MGYIMGVLAVGSGLVGAALHAVNAAADRGVEPSFWLLSALGAFAFGITGAVVSTRSQVRRIPLLLSAIGLGQGLALLFREYALLGEGPLDWLALWLGSWLWAPSYIASAALLPLLLPDGFLPSSRWRPALVLSIVALAAQASSWALTPYDLQDVPLVVRDLGNPVGVAAAASPVVFGVVSALTLLAVGLALASVAARWRESTGERRQQLKWLLVGGAATVVIFALGFLVPQPAGEVVAALAAIPVPAACGVAALRHRLWDVDLVVSVGLRYTILSAVVIAVYATIVAVLGASTGAPVVATAVVALVLLPLHSWLQRWTNRLVHGEPDDPSTALARLGEQLEATSDPADVADRLLPQVVARISGLLQSPYTAIRLADGGVVEHGMRPEDLDQVPLRYGGAEVGTLELAHRPRSRREAGRLDLLARQAAVAVHSVLLTREARRSRQLVVAAREEERRRLRWDLHDGVGPSIAALALQAETARDLVAEDPAAATEILDRLVPRLNGAVAEVRAIVHELRPPTLDELGLAGAVRELATRFAGRDLQVEVDLSDVGELPAAVDLAAYRIVSEALANAVRHSGAATVRVTAKRDGPWLSVEVADDGRGIDADGRVGVGLASMRARAEELNGRCVVGAPADGTGTVVSVLLPLILEEEPR
ncbi:sensor histidine kinase [Agromyces albus]|uniref:sensor histidine kinase n=1 Tax=Agromyces albus TaxID=205332 RepID=UPI00278A37A0|nr:sensor histidine kinase [Agromyces albus]MDQ0573978.1 two-component system NarL family sensor kinase [Agromyces albus]